MPWSSASPADITINTKTITRLWKYVVKTWNTSPTGVNKGQPFSHDQGHAYMPWLWSLSQGPVLGAPCCHKMLTTNAFLTDWEVILEGRSTQSLWRSHHLSWHINCLEMTLSFLIFFLALPPRPQVPSFACPDRQHIGGCLFKSTGGFVLMSTLQTGPPKPSVVSAQPTFACGAKWVWNKLKNRPHCPQVP